MLGSLLVMVMHPQILPLHRSSTALGPPGKGAGAACTQGKGGGAGNWDLVSIPHGPNATAAGA